jgi:hypothetical protein
MLTSLPRLKKLRGKIQQDLVEQGLYCSHLSGPVRETLMDYFTSVSLLPSDVRPGIEEVGDECCVEELQEDEGHIQKVRECVHVLLEPYIGQTLDDRLIRSLSIIFSGRLSEIRKGKLVQPLWVGTPPVKALLWVRNIRRIPTRGRQYQLELEVYAGPPAGSRWLCRMTGGLLQSIMREAGYRKYDKYRDEDISGLWFTATVWCSSSRFVFDNIEVSSSQKKANSELCKARRQPCKGTWKPNKGRLCLPCPLGRKQCARSRFAEAYSELRPCENGHNGWFLPGSTETVCWECLLRGVVKKGKEQ